jgi:glycosyltransferase involved in cell wall biosynthesis
VAEPDIVVVGTLPPPVHGASLITQRVADWLARRSSVRLIDIEPEGTLRIPRKVGRYARAVLALGGLGDRGLYLPSSGGEAILGDAAVCRRGRAAGCRIAIHHHSHAYVRDRSRPMATLVAAAGPDALHLVGCVRQGERLQELYPGIGHVLPVSNAPIAVDPGTAAPAGDGGRVRLGHLANLSLDKGLGEVLDLAEAMADQGRDVEVVLGGPVAAPDAEARIASARARLGDRLVALGSLDEAGKADFFGRLDLFVFPSRYRHETLPVVVHESMSHGVPVLATGIGCVPEQVGPAGRCVDLDADFVPAALPLVDQLVGPELRQLARQTYVDQLTASEDELTELEAHLLGR